MSIGGPFDCVPQLVEPVKMPPYHCQTPEFRSGAVSMGRDWTTDPADECVKRDLTPDGIAEALRKGDRSPETIEAAASMLVRQAARLALVKGAMRGF
jgi:hypothetical protein